MKHEDYCSHELSKKLKDKGFDWECANMYTEDGRMGPNTRLDSLAAGLLQIKTYQAPTLSQAQKWLREEKGIAINVNAHDGDKYDWDVVLLSFAEDFAIDELDRATWSRTYEEALSEAITETLRLI